MEYTFKEMIAEAQKAGLANEKTMWKSVDGMDEILCLLKKEHPEMYWKFMREQHGIMYNGHYDEAFAMYDVGQIRYTGRDGRKCEGAYWTCEQIESATKGVAFPSGTTKWDKFVAFNSGFADWCRVLTDEDIIKASHAFYFADEDAPGCKTWRYMAAMKMP